MSMSLFIKYHYFIQRLNRLSLKFSHAKKPRHVFETLVNLLGGVNGLIGLFSLIKCTVIRDGNGSVLNENPPCPTPIRGGSCIDFLGMGAGLDFVDVMCPPHFS